MFDDRIARRVGAIMMVLVGLAGSAVVMVDCARWRPAIRVTAYFAHIAQLTEGADVQIAGRVVGKVMSVSLVPSDRAGQGHPLAGTGGVALTLRIFDDYVGWTAKNGEVFINAKGLLGESYLEMGPPAEGDRSGPLASGDKVRGIDPPRIDQVLVKGFANMTAFRALVDEVAPSAHELRLALGRLGETIAALEPEPGMYGELGHRLRAVGEELSNLTRALDQADVGPAEVMAVVDAARALMARSQKELGLVGGALDALLADIDRIRARLPGPLVAKLETAVADARVSIAKLERTVAQAQELADRVRLGHGSIGALMNDPEFIDDAKKLGRILKRQPWRVIGHPRKQDLEKQP